MTGVVILGAGQAGLQLAVSLRELGFDEKITLIGDEPSAPYQRPPLSKTYLAGKVSESALFMQEPNFFEKHGIEFLVGEAAKSVHRDSRHVRTNSGEIVEYEHLVFATGARNRPLPYSKEPVAGVISLRTLEDTKNLQSAMASAERIVIIGAGFLGLEVATIATAAGRDVRVLEAGSRPLGRVVSEPVSSVVRRSHEEHGLQFGFSESVTELHSDGGTVRVVETRNGDRIPADLVLVAIGVAPNAELAASAGLRVDNGIIVDSQLLTDDPAVSAIGDCAAFPFLTDGGRLVRLESVQNAVDQARCVAERLTGALVRYDQVPIFWSDQAGLRLQMAGLTRGDETPIVRGDPQSRAFSVFCYRGDRLVAVESVSRLPDHMLARRLLRAGIHPSAAQVLDLDFDLKSLIR